MKKETYVECKLTYDPKNQKYTMLLGASDSENKINIFPFVCKAMYDYFTTNNTTDYFTVTDTGDGDKHLIIGSAQHGLHLPAGATPKLMHDFYEAYKQMYPKKDIKELSVQDMTHLLDMLSLFAADYCKFAARWLKNDTEVLKNDSKQAKE